MIQFAVLPQAHNEQGRPWYDTTEGILQSLDSLENLNRLVAVRHRAGYDRKESLNQFYVLRGRYHLDSCGNCGTVQGIPEVILPETIPLALHDDAFFALLKQQGGDALRVSISLDGGQLPTSDLRCPQCDQGWAIANCHDVTVWHRHETYPLADFVGKTLGDVQSFYHAKTDGLYRMQPDILIRNDCYIDPTPKYPNPDAEWQKGMVVNERGWINAERIKKTYPVAEAYMIREGDEGFFNVWKYYHKECNRSRLATEEERRFRQSFEKAGFTVTALTALPNQYCPCDKCPPWFDVETTLGVMRLGWRKRVISVDWSQLAPGGIPELFASEDVTKGETGIHAWGWEKLENYLGRIHAHLSEKQ